MTFFGASYVGGSGVGRKTQNTVSSVLGTQLRTSFPGMAGVHSNSL